jgi:succinoglycan biosynthesis protein ExoA
MPALNEEVYIRAAIESILPRPEEAVEYELLVVDGGSHDRTCAIVEDLSARNARIRLVRNARRIQSAGMNLAARASDPQSRYLVRADCHATYPQGYVARSVRLLAEMGASSTVVAMRTRGESCMQRAIAAAQNSRLGNGGSAHRLGGRSGFVDHGHHAAFEKNVFLRLGGYDETFTTNEDAEFDVRLIRSGGKIFLDGETSIEYFPRTTLPQLARQYFRFGWGRANTVLKHNTKVKLRQLLPVVALLGCAGSIAAAWLHPLLLAPAGLYGSLCAFWGVSLAVRERDPCLAAAGFAAVVMHMSWALGFLGRRMEAFRPAPVRQVPAKSAE